MISRRFLLLAALFSTLLSFQVDAADKTQLREKSEKSNSRDEPIEKRSFALTVGSLCSQFRVIYVRSTILFLMLRVASLLLLFAFIEREGYCQP
jgi:hypothetical protein